MVTSVDFILDFSQKEGDPIRIKKRKSFVHLLTHGNSRTLHCQRKEFHFMDSHNFLIFSSELYYVLGNAK